jgi:hypothetical protein
MANNFSYSWPFVLAFTGLFIYGLVAIFADYSRNFGYLYLGSGFLIIGLTALFIAGNDVDLGSQLVFGFSLGWMNGMSAVAVYRWLKNRNAWNKAHPDKPC